MVTGIDDGQQAAAGAGHQRADTEGDGVDALDTDAHQRGGVTVHPYGDDRAAEREDRRSTKKSSAGQREREHHGDDAVDRHDDVEGAQDAQIERDPPRCRGERQRHEVVDDHVEAEGQGQRRQHRPGETTWLMRPYCSTQPSAKSSAAMPTSDTSGCRPEVAPREERQVAAEDDERSVEHVDDVEHAPHEREPDCDAGVERAQQQAVDENLKDVHAVSVCGNGPT